MPTSHATLHPRPQRARERWIDLQGAWDFCHDDARAGLDARWYAQPERFTRTIIVPFPPESPASGIGETGFHPCVWYRRTFTAPSLRAGDRLLLHCGAVDYRADVWVDGQHVASHTGGHTPFSADITAALVDGDLHTLVIRAEDDPQDLAQPRGKQDWHLEPHDIWYQRTTGIWQPVWLEVVGPAYVEDLRWTPDLVRGVLSLQATVTRHDARPVHARVQLRLHERVIADDLCLLSGTTLQRDFPVTREALDLDPKRLYWSPDHPNLVEARVSLLIEDKEVDAVQSYAGMRSVGVDHGRFWLNGHPLFLRLALEQGYWPETHLAAPSDQALQEEVAIARSLGFNGVRIHQKVEDPRFLYWCDRLGLLVWGEMPSGFVYSTTLVERQIREWLEVVQRDYSHPCIIAWVPLNESWGVPALREDAAQRAYAQALYHLTHALDRTRPVIANDGWEHVRADIVGIHDYTFHGAALTRRYGSRAALDQTLREGQPAHHVLLLPDAVVDGQPVMITEFGGLSYQPAQGEEWFGYGTVRTAEEFVRKYGELVGALVDSPVLAGFCYTQLTDTRQETNGLVTERRVPKLDPAVVRAITERASAVTPGEEIDDLRAAAKGTDETPA